MTLRLRDHVISDREATGGSRRLAYTEWGDSGNPDILVCVHGLTRNSRDFDYIAESLQSDYRVIAIDMPGRGRSDWLNDKTRYNYATYIADIQSLMQSLEIKQADWLGTSMGGLIGMVLSASAPGFIQRMVMNDVGPYLSGKALQRIQKYVSIQPRFSTLKEVENHLRTVLAPFGINDDTHWHHIVEHSAMIQDDGTLRLAYDADIVKAFAAPKDDGTVDDVDLWPIWEQVKVPLLLVRGETSDILTRETADKMVQSKGSNIDFVEFPGIGHAPALMETTQIRAIKDWLL